MRECRACGQHKPDAEFRLKRLCRECERNYHAAYYARHREKRLEASKEYHANNRERRKAYLARRKDKDRIYNRERNLRRNYGIDQAAWDAQFEFQRKCCAVCGTPRPGRSWHLDHCHATGKIRGILCQPCNLMLGHARDNQDVLQKAIDYLRR